MAPATSPSRADNVHDGPVRVEQWIEQSRQGRSGSSKVLGWAWATVDLERALVQAGEHAALSWEPVEDELLGARGLRLAGVEPAVILMEPSTEGRLAGWLARNGEGEAVVYREADSDATVRPRMTALGLLGWVEGADPRPPVGAPLEVRIASARRW